MKKSFRSLLALLMALILLLSLTPTAFALKDDDDDEDYDWFEDLDDDDDDDDDDGDHGKGIIVPQVIVFFEVFDVPIDVGQTTKVAANVTDADSDATYDWYCSDPGVVSISGRKDTVSVTGLSAGTAQITLTVTRGDGLSEDSDYFTVVVEKDVTPVEISGGGTVFMEAGDTVQLSAGVSGGSGSYEYDWDAYGDAALSFTDHMRGNAEVYAGRGGSGTVTLFVSDAEDPSNCAIAEWFITVEEQPEIDPPEIRLSRGSIDIGTGGTASLKLDVSGGSGNFDYLWTSDNSAVAFVVGDGKSATVYATDTLLPHSSTAEISVFVHDNDTGLTSNTATCIVTVSGGSASYDVSGTASVGSSFAMNDLAALINDFYKMSFGSSISYSASVMFGSAGNSSGSIRLQDSTAVKARTNYAFATFQDMVFSPTAGGSFSTSYQIVDGGNTISGTLTITVVGGIPVRDVSLSASSMQLAPYSAQYLSVAVVPHNASYTVTWSVSDSRIVSVSGSGSMVTVSSGSREGSAKITASVTDANGSKFSASCTVTVQSSEASYDPSLTVMLGSDYYGAKLADSLSSQFKAVFGTYPLESASMYFTSLGSSRYGTMYMKDGTAVAARRSYTFRDFVDMYFIPAATGTYSAGYQLEYQGHTLQGTINVYIQSASISVALTPAALQMSSYSTQNLLLTVEPSSADYRVSWSSSDSNVATVSGSNTSATVSSSGASGTATITAVITDRNGVAIRRSCTVVVNNTGAVFNPSVSTTLGVPYYGTGTSSAMRSQFQSVYGIALADSAVIRFASTGNNEVAVMRLSDGSMIRPNTDYTLAQYVAMYTQPVSAGTYYVPYTLTYSGKTLKGTISVVVNSASVNTDLTLASRAPYTFSEALNGGTGASILSDSIRNTVGAAWSYICFAKSADGTGVLYLNSGYTPIDPYTNINAAGLSNLCFVPGDQTGAFSAPFTIYSATGGVLGSGTLRITVPGISFVDVPADAYYASAVNWAVQRGVTSGTGGSYFSPDMTVTRGQAVTFLWRAAGQPKVSAGVNPFTDVPQGAYYYDAVLWAVQQGITNGTSDTAFSPDLPLHRDQMLTFLCRANGGYAGGADWASLAVSWAGTRGLLVGLPGTFVPSDDCPRSEVVYFLWKNYN